MRSFKFSRLSPWSVFVALVLSGCLTDAEDEQIRESARATAAITVTAADSEHPSPCQLTGAHYLAGGSKSFGACVGECQFTFETQLSVDKGCPIASLDVCGWGVSGCTRTNTGLLTPLGVARSQALAEGLSDQRLKRIYGCPDCADGGTSQLMLSRDGAPITVSYEYGNPPEILGKADRFVASVITALNACVSNDNVEITQSDCTPSNN